MIPLYIYIGKRVVSSKGGKRKSKTEYYSSDESDDEDVRSKINFIGNSYH
jgi:hypothetical protein